MANIKYFNGDRELTRIQGMPNAQFLAMGGTKSKANYFDGYQRLCGVSADGQMLPVERAITYKRFPSRHVCSAKCMGGKINGVCECSCGGKNHGLGSVSSFKQLLAA
jgi:hypothetical protein